MDFVEIIPMIQNFLGSQQDTVDFKLKMIKELHSYIDTKAKQEKFISLLENEDKNNDGKIEQSKFVLIIKEITGGNKSKY